MENNNQEQKPNETSQPVSKQPSNTMVYVSNLPFAATDEDLKDLFKEFEVKTAYVAKRRNGRSKGFGFVNLGKAEQQQGAIDKVNGSTLDGRVLTAKVAFNDPRRNDRGELKEEFKVQKPAQQSAEPSKTAIYVSNLPFALDDEGLQKVFEEFKVKSCTVATRQNGRSMGFGFVEFNSAEDQEKALKYDKKVVDEREIAVRVARNYLGPNRPRRPRRRQKRRTFRTRQPPQQQQFVSKRDPKTTLYVANLPFDLDHNDLTEIFSEFNVKEATIATFRSGRSRGFGFVEFYNTQSQQNALEALDQSEVNGRVITVRVARQPRRRRPPNVRRRPRTNRQREPSKTLLYVSNLPFALTDEEFAKLFTGFKVSKAYVATKRNGRSKGFGFVDFGSNEEQQKALKELGELESMGRKLTLQVANKVVEAKPEQPAAEQNNQPATTQPVQENK